MKGEKYITPMDFAVLQKIRRFREQPSLLWSTSMKWTS